MCKSKTNGMFLTKNLILSENLIKNRIVKTKEEEMLAVCNKRWSVCICIKTINNPV